MLNKDSLNIGKKNYSGEAPQNNGAGLHDHKDVLQKANRIILNQHMAVMEEQRLNVLFQILGITFHELNQPLTSLLGNIELMLLNQDNPQKLKENIKRVDDAGKRFSSIIRKIQNIRQGKTMIQDYRFCPMKTNKTWNIQAFVQDEKVLKKIESLMVNFENIVPGCSGNLGRFDSFNIKEDTDLIILDEKTSSSCPNKGLVRRIRARNNELAILAVLMNQNEKIAFELIHEGVDDYCTLAELNEQNIKRMISNAKEKAWGRHQLKSALNDLAGASIQDEQTGLFQRRFFKDALDRETTMAKRKETQCIVCKLEIEGISAANPSNGGDDHKKSLMDTAKIIQNILGDTADLVCRYGNESFAFILPNTCADEAQRICEILQASLEKRIPDSISLEKQPRIHIGMILSSPDRSLNPQELMKKLDEATSQARISQKSPVFL